MNNDNLHRVCLSNAIVTSDKMFVYLTYSYLGGPFDGHICMCIDVLYSDFMRTLPTFINVITEYDVNDIKRDFHIDDLQSKRLEMKNQEVS